MRPFHTWFKFRLALLTLAVLAGRATTMRSEGPLVVGGLPCPANPPPGLSCVPSTVPVPGQPFIWSINPLTYWTDQGQLGTQTNAQADALVQAAFQAWQDVSTASITFSQAGKLPQDVTANNIMTVENQLNACSTPIDANNPSFLARDRTIVYDTDGSIIKAGGEDPNMVLGFADAFCFSSDGTTNFFTRGFAVLNGKPLTSGTGTITDLKATMVHEFGHMIGNDHSQINLQCLTSSSPCTASDLAGVPIMFPVLIQAKTVPTTDDQAVVSVHYPETTYPLPAGKVLFSTLGRIQGRVFFSDGLTAAQGFNVIARNTGNPGTIAVSNVSGYLYTADAGNAAVPGSQSEEPFGSRDQTLIGFFDIPALPPGSYTLEVEGIHNSDPIPFINSSSVGPIGGLLGVQFGFPGTCTPQFLADPATHAATCTSGSAATLNVTAGTTLTGTDIILVGTPPRFDAYEDGP